MKAFYKMMTVLAAFGLIASSTFFVKERHKEGEENEKETNKQEMLEAMYQEEFEKTVDPKLGYVPTERLLAAYEQMKTMQGGKAALGLTWRERGPTNIGGRTRAFMFDLNDPNYQKVWAGSVSGGLWYTNDITAASPLWHKVDDFLDNMAISCLAQHPRNHDTLYFGTGEWFTGAYGVRGLGIWRSVDGGETWAQLPSTNNSDFYYVNSLKFSPSGYLFAGTNTGLYRSSDYGHTWVRMLGTDTDICVDIEIASNGRVYASVIDTDNISTIYRSYNDLGAAYQNIQPSSRSYGRIELGIAPSDPNVIYALAEERYRPNAKACDSIFYTNDGGNTWTMRAAPYFLDNGGNPYNFAGDQAWYALTVAVQPSNPNRVYIGGLDLARSDDAGQTWTRISRWDNDLAEPDYVHADHHNIVFRPTYNYVAAFCNDGGVFYSTQLQLNQPIFNNRSLGYRVTQFWGGDIHPSVCSNYLLGGTQDNGSMSLNDPQLTEAERELNADGMHAHISQVNGNIQVASKQFQINLLSTNGGVTWSPLHELMIGSNWRKGRFVNPTDLDDQNNILYMNDSIGAFAYYSNLNNYNNATYTKVDIRSSIGNRQLSAIKVNPSATYMVWAAACDDDSVARIIRIEYANSPSARNIVDVTSNIPAIAGMYISSIDIDPNNWQHVIISCSNYGLVKLYETTNNGISWTPVNGNLPDMPVRSVVFDPINGNHAFIGTDLGVWSTDNLDGISTQWSPDNTGLGTVRVERLSFRKTDKTLAAFTHGRGVFTAQMKPDNVYTPVEQAQNQAQGYLGPYADVYFYSTAGKLLARIKNLSSHDYGCTSVSVTRASNVTDMPTAFLTNNTREYLMRKTFEVEPTNPNNLGSYKIWLYFGGAEYFQWRLQTGVIWWDAHIVKCSGDITQVTPATPNGGGTMRIMPNDGYEYNTISYVSATFVGTGFSSFGVGYPESLLAAQLVRFDGKKENNRVKLTWTVENEQNMQGYDIEKSDDGKNFYKIGFEKAYNTTNAQDYTFFDNTSTPPQYYRLKLLETNGNSQYSKIIYIENKITSDIRCQIAPNPVADYLNLQFDNPLSNGFSIEIYDISGKLVFSEKQEPYIDRRTHQIAVNHLPNGTYILKINAQSGKTKSLKFVKKE